MEDYHTIIRFKASPAGEPGYVDESDINGDLSTLLKKKDLGRNNGRGEIEKRIK